MCVPEPNDPQDAVVASQYKDNKALFNKTAKEWTAKYANPDSIMANKIKTLMEMGFDEQTSKKALETHNWDENLAANSLLC